MKHMPEITVAESVLNPNQRIIGLEYFRKQYPWSQTAPDQMEYFQVFGVKGNKVIVNNDKILGYLTNVEHVKRLNKPPEGCLLSILKGLLGIYYFEEKKTKDFQRRKYEELAEAANNSTKALEHGLELISKSNQMFVDGLPSNLIKEVLEAYGPFCVELALGVNNEIYAFLRHEVTQEYREYRHRDGSTERPNSSIRYFVTQSGELFKISKQNYSYKSDRSTVLGAGTPDVLSFIKQNLAYFNQLVVDARQNGMAQIYHSKDKPYDLHISRVDLGLPGQFMNEIQSKNARVLKTVLLDSQNEALFLAFQIASAELKKMKAGTPDTVLLNK